VLFAAAKVLLPAGLQYLGVCGRPESVQADSMLAHAGISGLLQQGSSVDQGVLVILTSSDSSDPSIRWQQQGPGAKTSQQSVTVVPLPDTDHGSVNSNSLTDSYAWANQLQMCLLRCHVVVTLDVYVREPAQLEAAIQAAVKQACEQWQASEEKSYIVSGSGPKAAAAQLVQVGSTSQQGSTIQELATRMGSATTHPLPLAGPPLLTFQPAVTHAAPDAGQGKGKAAGPVLRYQPVSGSGPVTHHTATVGLDVLVVAPLSASVSHVSTTLILPALRAQLQAAGRMMASEGRVLDVTAHHFLAPGRAHHVTVMYPHLAPDAEANEAQLTSRRKTLHTMLGLPIDRPALRVANALPPAVCVLTPPGSAQQTPAAAAPVSLRLKDVHLGLSPPGE
jgi:hypothetical protein